MAVSRGLLLDLLTEAPPAEVTASHTLFVRLLAEHTRSEPTPPPGSR